MIQKLKKEVLNTIRSGRLNVFLVFLVSAFVILIFTKLSKAYTNTVAFNLEYQNVPQEKVILKDTSRSFEITLKTHGFKWLNYYFSKPTFTVDFSKDVVDKNNAFIFTKTLSQINDRKQFQNHIEILGIKPDTLIFHYDTNLVKKVPVIADVTLNFEPGYNSYTGVKMQPDSITIIGPQDKVSRIDALKTEVVTYNAIKSNIEQDIQLVLPEQEDNLKFSNKRILIRANVEKFTEGSVNIPITVTNLPKGMAIKYFPKTVKVSYYTSLANFKTIKAKDFKIECNYKKVTKGQPFLIPELVKIPEYAKRVKVHQQHIEFIIL